MKIHRIRAVRALALAISAAAAVSAPGLSSAGNVQVEIDLTNGVTILYYHSSLDVGLDLASLLVPTGCTGSVAAGAVECASTATQTQAATVAGGIATATFAAPVTAGVDPSAVPLVLQNVWALRALGGSSGNTTVTATLGTAGATLSNGASTIVLSGIDVGANTPGALAFNAAVDAVTVADPGLGAPLPGYVALRLNLANALATGAYTKTGSAQYTITVTAT